MILLEHYWFVHTFLFGSIRIIKIIIFLYSSKQIALFKFKLYLMFISSNSFNALHDAFKMCNDPKTIKEAEKKLKALACYPYYPRLLIDYCVNY